MDWKLIGSRAVVPGFLLMCLLLGGSAQGAGFNMALQLVSILILIVVWGRKSSVTDVRPPSLLAGVLIAATGYILLQLVPLPPNLWLNIPGRAAVSEGFEILGAAYPSLPFTVSPQRTISALLAVLPSAAMLSLFVRKAEPGYLGTLVTLLCVTSVSVLLGVLQRAGSSDFYLYPVTNFGAATGFFANSNHLGALLLTSLPFLAVFGSRAGNGEGGSTEKMLSWLLVGAAALVVALGIITNGSLAVLLLGPPVALLSSLLLFPRLSKSSKKIVVVASLGAVIVLPALIWTLAGDKLGQNASLQTRAEIWATSFQAMKAFLPLGSGFGTFEAVYRLFENPSRVDWVFVNHAHNGYLEIGVELGLIGIALIALFLVWWVRHTVTIWKTATVSPAAKAATIASGALLLHSCVDYPLRTAALSVVFAMCLGIMVRKPSALNSGREVARHLAFEELTW